LTRYPVFTLVAISAVGCILAAAALFAGTVWLAVVTFVATVLILCGLLAAWSGRPVK
jgi:hypothetical protein